MKLLVIGCLLIVTSGVTTGAPAVEGLTPEEEDAMLEELLDAAVGDRTRRSGLDKKSWKLHKLTSLSSLSHHHPEHEYHDYGGHLDYDHKSFDVWAFKKAILATVLQAIKAVTGGVIALKGHLLKAKGHLVVAKGEVLKVKGEAIKDFGRHIATKALLHPVLPPTGLGYDHHHHHHHPPIHSVHSPPVIHSHIHHTHHEPHHHNPHHGGSYLPPPPPVPPHPEYGHYDHHDPYLKRDDAEQKKDEHLSEGVQAGLIVLKPFNGQHESFSVEQQNVRQLHPEQDITHRLDNFGFYS